MNALLRLLARRWELPEAAQASAAGLLAAWQEGHTGVNLSGTDAVLLGSCTAVAGSLDAEPRPLVLQEGLLQSWQHASAERELARGLLALADPSAAAEPLQREAQEAFRRLAPDPDDAQARALRLGLERRLVLITGGPGTGKTHTAARLLGLLLEASPRLRFALAAPTGKAAQRLGESVAKAAEDPQVRAALPQGAALLAQATGKSSTLHRLLEWFPGEDACRRHQGRPLPLDLVIVDEASMLDLLLWRALLRALPKGCRLVVLGDPLQLESIEPGRVLGALVEAAGASGGLNGCLARLDRNYRFEAHPGIGALANAVRDHDTRALLAAARPDADAKAEVQRLPASAQGLDQALDRVWPEVLALAQAREPEAALRALERLRILCALNQGPWGVQGLNARVAQRLAAEGLRHPARPVLVTVNDPHSGLFNGDLGVVLPGAQGERAVFPGSGERSYPAAKLPQSQPAWAITVHRSQGSEYGTVLLALPPDPHELVGPELLYTAVTRAKERVLLVASEAALAEGCRPQRARVGGLALHLR